MEVMENQGNDLLLKQIYNFVVKTFNKNNWILMNFSLRVSSH